MWSPSSDEKAHAPRWYAERGISAYSPAKPLDGEGDPWEAEITIFELARTMSGTYEYVERKKSTLTDLEQRGLG